MDLFCERRSCFVVCCFGFEKFQYTNVVRLVYFHNLRLTAAAVLRMQWGQHEEQPKAPPARSARRDRVPPGVIAPEQEEEEQGDQEEEASVTCTVTEESSDEQDGSPQDTPALPSPKISINMGSC